MRHSSIELVPTYEAPPDEAGSHLPPWDVVRRSGETSLQDGETLMSDQDLVRNGVEGFMAELYGTDRYSSHNARLINNYDAYSHSDGPHKDPSTVSVNHMAILLHDFAENCVEQPEKTAARLGFPPEKGCEIRQDALKRLTEIYDRVEDKDGLIKAYLFAIDASKWEEAARIWRDEAQTRIAEIVQAGDTTERNGNILLAAVNKAELPPDVTPEEHEQVLRMSGHCLINLRLGAIQESTLNHNISGIFLKGLETLDNIKHPPAGNPASTYRDCIEAMNFFVPALMTLGYKDLAAELHGLALEWFYDDPHSNAKHQHELSKTYFDEIKQRVTTLREAEFAGYDVGLESRLKTEGSIRQKLVEEPKYATARMVPDGIGMAFIVPDYMVVDGEIKGSELSHFAEVFSQQLTNSGTDVEIGHPAGDKPYEENDRKSGYQAVHMTFYYHPEGKPEVTVPFEIQVMTKEQYRLKLYGESSDIFYKFGKREHPTEEELQYLEHLARRAEAERVMAPGTTVHSIGNMVANAPELPSVFNKLYAAVEAANGMRVLVPRGTEAAIAKMLSHPSSRLEGTAGDLVVLPAARVTVEEFKEAINMFDRDLFADKRIQDALKLVQGEAAVPRNDNKTSVLEGHLLPAALQALVMAVQSGVVWDGEKPATEHMVNITTIAILHDYVEDELKRQLQSSDLGAVHYARNSLFFTLRSKFGNAIANSVLALTAPSEAEVADEFERREHYKANIESDGYAKLVKPADRWQNHMTDLAKLVEGEVDDKAYNKIINYFAKTDRHLSTLFTGDDMPKLYRRIHGTIWHMAWFAGYSD